MQKVLKYFRNILITLMCILTGANVFVITLQVILRYFLKVSIAWSSEFAGISLVWITFLGATLATLDETNINFNNLIDVAKPLPKLILKLASKVFVAVVCYVLMYYGYKSMIVNVNTMLVALPITMAVATSVLPLSGFFMAIALIINGYKDVREYLGYDINKSDNSIYDDVPEEIMQKATAAIENTSKTEVNSSSDDKEGNR